jgi:L-fuculose-phosphate aldolase
MTASLERARAAVAACGRRLVSTGLVVGSAGNVSVRAGDQIAITPSGVPYDRIEPADVCVIDLAGRLLDGPDRPSSETPMHLSVYDSTDAAAIVHHHGVHSAAVSTVLDELPAIHYATTQLGGTIRVAGYETYGTPELALSVHAALEDRTGALIQNHGAVAYGRSLDEAFDRAQLLEWLCEVYARASALGTPRILSAAELDAVNRRRTGDRP